MFIDKTDCASRRSGMIFIAILLLLISYAFVLTAVTQGQRVSTFDLVLIGGRVMDPESGLDAVRNIGVSGGRISAISAGRLQGREIVDVSGLVVAPGFIDLHSHGQTDENYRYKAADGVTTALEMEVGVSPVAAWYREREGKALVNFGATVGHIPARMTALHDSGAFLPRDNAITRRATTEDNRKINDLIRQGLDEGALGIGFGINYVADIAIFDPARVVDRATFENPGQYAEGFRHVLVNGVFVVRDSKLVGSVFPGKAIRRPHAGQ